jgi:hypothetical protein
MMFLHILDDFVLQPLGFLAKGKQKDWWKENAPGVMYDDDYIVCLFMHSFSWTFMIMLPLYIVNYGDVGTMFYVMFGVNVFLHALIDDMKANEKRINLIVDQFIHVLQIILTYMSFIV